MQCLCGPGWTILLKYCAGASAHLQDQSALPMPKSLVKASSFPLHLAAAALLPEEEHATAVWAAGTQ